MSKTGLVTKKLDVFLERVRLKRNARPSDLTDALEDAAELIINRAQRKYLRRGPLHRRSGTLIDSITRSSVTRRGKKGYSISVGTPVFYGRVHEFGAQTPGHIVRPKKAKYLRFRIGPPFGAHGVATGPWVAVKKVTMKPKPWLEPSFKDKQAKILKLIAKAGGKIV